MSDTKHTPEPWTLTTVPTTAGICHKIGPFPWKQGKQNHACIYGNHASHNGTGEHEAELLANARLIAAAPDLLEALQMISDGPHDADAIADMLPAIRAVIAKATGADHD